MHFTIKKSHLVDALSHVNKAVSAKNAISILTGIKFEISNDGLTLTGSDSDISIQIFIPSVLNEDEIVQIFEPGKIVLPKYTFEIIKKLPNDEIEFKIVDHLTVLIKSGSSEFRLIGFEAEEYPELPQIDQKDIFTIQGKLLKTMIIQTIFAVSTKESRPILTGVLWNLNGQNLKFVATDSHRLAIRESTVENPMGLSFNNVVIPGKSLNELSKILDDHQVPVEVIVTDHQLFVKIDNLVFFSRLLDGTYPDISRIIPEKGKTKIRVQTKEILDAIERVALIAKDAKNNIVKLTTLDNQLLEISSNSLETGKANEQILAKELTGEPIKISFNAKYTIDALKTIDSQEIDIEFTGALSPFVIKPVDHDRMLHLILPIRTY
ncbi:DNA polymerase III subunit beta [Vulcanibacillus modesticaldus]|uniref:Beta sliding clamp n=1 Tax=Vulcanibacillus modesticaldus TaxID=337097 RepID=A0A1D2YV87_9BACI|nr:DNA polymerase III subunit beta [Vulcanibacillus modesticaldus]OEF99629.1 DNA polymerase III subunit beta [Vulcanibacillus modesticaldus]